MSEQLLQNAQTHHRSGRLLEAAHLYQEYLRTNPMHTEALYALGMIYFRRGQFEQSQQTMADAIQSNPQLVDAMCMRGIALMRLNCDNEALASFDQALAIDPASLTALTNRATVLLETRRYEDALAGFEAVLAVAPLHEIAWYNHGNTLTAMGRLEDALVSFERALVLKPDFPQARNNRDSALFELRRAQRCPPGYVRKLFDEWAVHYDDTMLNKLGYRGHVHMRQLAERMLPRLTPPWRILDLGAGTGLVGDVFKDLARGGALDGIDLSKPMIEAARKRGIYTDLVLGDVEEILSMPGPCYELIISADTTSYFGDLTVLFAGIAQRLEPSGYYLFAAESMEGESWEQSERNRFRHSEAYLRSQAAKVGLEAVEFVPLSGEWTSGTRSITRQDERLTEKFQHEIGSQLRGFLVALRKPA